MNNKGFAITTILYGTMILFLMLLLSMLGILSTYKDRLSMLIDSNNGARVIINDNVGIKTINLLAYITNLYSENYDSSYNNTFSDGTGINYFAPSIRLMNDGLDSSGNVTNDPYIGNIRYYGPDDSNLKNYIFFNCSDYSNQSSSTCELWRIIGVVDGKVKIVSDEPLGNYAWNDSGDFFNDWTTASLMNDLNIGTYYEGIKNKNIKTLSLISSSTWYINAMEDNNIYANASYKAERVGDNMWIGNIALLYPSDCGYAVDLGNCGYKMSEYNNCIFNNWINNVLQNHVVSYSWLLTPTAFYNYDAWYISATSGKIVGANTVPSKMGVSPTLYLDPRLNINLNTKGSRNNPYELIVD